MYYLWFKSGQPLRNKVLLTVMHYSFRNAKRWEWCFRHLKGVM